MARHATTNYGCVDLELINELYAVEYQEKISGHRRLLMRPVTQVVSAAPSNTGVHVDLHDRMFGESSSAEYTAVVCATGFRSIGVSDVLAGWDVAPERIGWPATTD
jgi:L-ornithine N5-monooxygenase